MKISFKRFLIITLLFLLVPISVNWRILIFGQKTNGIVVDYIKTYQYGHEVINYSVIQYKANNRYYEITGAEYKVYPLNTEITVVYKKSNPEKFLLLTFPGLFYTNKMIVPGVLLIVWFAFYLAMSQTYNETAKSKFELFDRNQLSR